MAYNSSKGPRHFGDINYEADSDETQIDFDNDFIALRTDGVQRFAISGSKIEISGALLRDAANAYDIGSISSPWSILYAAASVHTTAGTYTTTSTTGSITSGSAGSTEIGPGYITHSGSSYHTVSASGSMSSGSAGSISSSHGTTTWTTSAGSYTVSATGPVVTGSAGSTDSGPGTTTHSGSGTYTTTSTTGSMTSGSEGSTETSGGSTTYATGSSTYTTTSASGSYTSGSAGSTSGSAGATTHSGSGTYTTTSASGSATSGSGGSTETGPGYTTHSGSSYHTVSTSGSMSSGSCGSISSSHCATTWFAPEPGRTTTATGYHVSSSGPVSGSELFGLATGIRFPIVTVTSTYTASIGDYTILANTNTANITVRIPSASIAMEKIYNVKKIHASNTMIIISDNGTIDGDATKSVTSLYESLTVHSDGINWHLI